MISSSPTLLRDADCLELVCQDFLLDYYMWLQIYDKFFIMSIK